MKGVIPITREELQRRRLAAAAAVSAPTPPSVIPPTPALTVIDEDEIQIHSVITTAQLRYSGMLDIPHFMCTCGTIVAVHDSRGMDVAQYQEVIGSKKPCCVRFFTLKRYTFCCDFDMRIGPQGQEASSTRKIIKLGAVVQRPIVRE